MKHRLRSVWLTMPGLVIALGLGLALAQTDDENQGKATLLAGATAVDISPSKLPSPVNGSMVGTMADAIADPMHARTLVLENGGDSLAICIVDVCMISDEVVLEAAELASEKTGLNKENIVIAATHTHSAATVCGVFGSEPDPAYLKELPGRIAEGIVQAWERREPAEIAWGAKDNPRHVFNRRWLLKDSEQYEDPFGHTADRVRMNPGNQNPALTVQSGPVDPEVAVISVRRASDESPICILANYGLHYVGNVGKISADYFGMVAHELATHLEATDGNGGGDQPFVGIMTNGTSADVNNIDFSGPRPKGKKPREQATFVARDVAKTVAEILPTLSYEAEVPLAVTSSELSLGVRKPDPDEIKRAQKILKDHGDEVIRGKVEVYARETVKMDRYPDEVTVRLKALAIGDLAIATIPCEVFAETGLRLKNESPFGQSFVIELANGYNGYLAPPRQHELGGYETWRARSSYLEEVASEKITDQLLDDLFVLAQKERSTPQPLDAKGQPVPLSPEDSLAKIHVPTGYRVELVAAEPLVQDPVAIDWGADGRLWVAEMLDYPIGMDDEGKPGGRIKVLEDTDGDGHFDKGTIFAEGLAFPKGLKVWQDGVFITAAPDVLFARDTNGDGKADEIKSVLAGFAEGNHQLRVNSLRLGTDGWIYGANGLSDGEIHTVDDPDRKLTLRGHDFRFRPWTGELELVSGESQFGRAHDGFGNWFGIQNSFPCFHFVAESRDLLRNPHVSAGTVERQMAGARNPPVFPASQLRERLHADFMANRFTSCCGLEIYRDRVLFPADGKLHAFICEPVHNCVSRLVLTPEGVSFTGARSLGEQDREFFASEDLLSRPVMARTGPDGGLWVVDMYRDQVEHPQWIPKSAMEQWKKQSSLRAGHEYGRIYRVILDNGLPGPPDPSATVEAQRRKGPVLSLELSEMGAVEDALQSANGVVLDLVTQYLLEGPAREPNFNLVEQLTAPLPSTRAQALGLLSALEMLEIKNLADATLDPDPRVRAFAWRISGDIEDPEGVLKPLRIQALNDESPAVQLQALWGLSTDPQTSGLEERAISKASPTDRPVFLQAAASLLPQRYGLISKALEAETMKLSPETEKLCVHFLETTWGIGQGPKSLPLLRQALPEEGESLRPEQIQVLATALRIPAAVKDANLIEFWKSAQPALASAEELLRDKNAPPEIRSSALELVAALPKDTERDNALVGELLETGVAPSLQLAAVRLLFRRLAVEDQRAIFSEWKRFSPETRTALLDVELRRKGGINYLLTAVEEGRLAPTDFDFDRRRRLLRSKAPGVADRAKKIFASVTGSRAKAVAEHQDVLTMKANRDQGKAVFAKACALCHQIGDLGKPIGPDLRSVTDRSPKGLLLAILDPNQAVDPKYQTYSLETKDGDILVGMVAGESGGGIEMVTPDGRRHEIPGARIAKLESLGISLMPVGLEAGLTKQELADLIAWLGY